MIEFCICCFMSIHYTHKLRIKKNTQDDLFLWILFCSYTRKRRQHGDSTDTTLFLLWSGRNTKIPQQKIN